MPDASDETIQSSQNPRIKQTLRLRQAQHRRRAGRFLIDGVPEIQRAIAAGIELDCIFCLPEDRPLWLANVERLPADCRLQAVTAPLLQKLSYGQHGSQAVAVAATPDLALDGCPLKPEALYLVMDRTEKPGNLGACARSAAACDAAGLILTNPICEPFNPNAIRASRGCLFSLPLAVCTDSELQAACRSAGLKMLTARVDAADTLWELDLTGGAAIVVGNETHGLGSSWSGPDLQPFRIPMARSSDSLNLAISAAVTLFESRRQRAASEFDPHQSSG